MRELLTYAMLLDGRDGMRVEARSEEEARAKIERKMAVKPYASVKLDAWRRAGKPVRMVEE